MLPVEKILNAEGTYLRFDHCRPAIWPSRRRIATERDDADSTGRLDTRASQLLSSLAGPLPR
jgi:hypothetical protein